MIRRGLILLGLVSLAFTGCQTPVGPTPAPTATGSASASSASATATPSASTPATATPAPLSACQRVASEMSVEDAAGQLVMMGVTGSLDATGASVLSSSRIGSVILMGTASGGVKGTASRVAAIRKAGGDHGILVGVDQEGGTVRRLQGAGFSTMPSAVEQAAMSDADLRTAAHTWGSELARAGINLDFAPVVDVVPPGKASTNEPIGKLKRGYGSTPEKVADKATAFIEGLQQANVGATAKHFPNLGQVTGNTDFAAKVVDSVTTADDPALLPYRRAIAADVASIMVSTAYFTRIDGSSPAAFSPTVVGLVRGLGFTGVITSDDLGAAKAVASVPVKQRAVRFVRAGGDLAISVDPSAASAMVAGLVEQAHADPAFAAQVRASAARVLELKQRLGVASCDS